MGKLTFNVEDMQKENSTIESPHEEIIAVFFIYLVLFSGTENKSYAKEDKKKCEKWLAEE